MLTELNELSPEKRDMLASLPYRVGLWVSQSDDSGGGDSDEQEMRALSSILHAYAEEVFGAETVQHIISATITQKENWPRWGEHMSDVIMDCRHAVDVLSEVVDRKEVNAFKQHLVEIGEAVALAFREVDDNMPLPEKLKFYIEYYKGKHKAAKTNKPYKTFQEFLNISPSERRALSTLAEALNVPYL
jgi:hypothetical protein